MALSHDSQGFLVGSSVTLEELASDIGDIRDDIRAMRRALQAREAGRAARRSGDSAVMVPAGRSSSRTKLTTDAAVVEPAARGSRPAAVTVIRDASGRFTSTGDKPSSSSSGRPGTEPDTRSGLSNSAAAGIGNRVAAAVTSAMRGTTHADVSAKAFQEIIEPVGRGFGIVRDNYRHVSEVTPSTLMSPRGNSADKWMRRDARLTARNTTLIARAADAFHRVALRRLKGIEERPEGKKDGGGLWGLLATIPAALAAIPKLLTKLLGGAINSAIGLLRGALVRLGLLSAAKNAGVDAVIPGGSPKAPKPWGKNAPGLRGNRLMRLARVALSRGGKFLKPAAKIAGAVGKRIPVLGSLLALGLGAMESSDIEADTSLSRDQKNAKQGKNWGRVAGGIGGAAGGAAIGTLIFPGVGTVIGGVLGAVLGDWLGGNLGEEIGSRFSGFMQAAMPVWNEIKATALGTWDWIKGVATDNFELAAKTWDVGKKLFESIAEKWGNLVTSFAQKIAAFYEGLKSLKVIGPAIQKAEEAAKKVADFSGVVAEVTYESAKKAAGAAKDAAVAAAETQATATMEAVKAAGNVLTELVPKGLQESIQARRNFSDETKAGIVSASAKAGVDPGIVSKIAAFESRFRYDVKAPTSSAYGIGQITDGTWLDLLNSHGAKYNVAGAGTFKKGDPRLAKLRNDKKLQLSMLAELTRENIELGRKLGGTNDDANVYALHNLGAGDARKFLKALKSNPDAAVSSVLRGNVIAGNKSLYGDGSLTLAESYRRMGNYMAEGNAFATEARAAIQPTTINALEAINAPAVTAAPIVPLPKLMSPPPAPKAVAIPEPAKVEIPLGSPPAPAPIVIQQPTPDVGQDVRDRGIAHIVTGGIGYSR